MRRLAGSLARLLSVALFYGPVIVFGYLAEYARDRRRGGASGRKEVFPERWVD